MADRVAHVCQRCCNPLKLDPELESLQHEKILALIDAQTPALDDTHPSILIPVKNAGADYPRYYVPPSSQSFNTEADAMTMLRSSSTPTTSLAHHQTVSASLFDILSGRTEVDHPLCQECADVLITAKRKCIEYQEEELNCLKSYLNHLDSKAAQSEARIKAKQSGSDATATGVRRGSNASECSSVVEESTKWLSCLSSSEQSSTMPCGPSESQCKDDDSDSESDEEESEYGSDFSEREDQESTVQKASNTKEDRAAVDRTRRKSWRKSSLEELQATVDKLRTKLEGILAVGAKLDRQLASDEAELKRRSEEFDKAQTQYNEQKLALIEEEEELFALEARVKRSERHLQRLLRTNVLNTAFPIWYDQHFCIINGLHMGRLPNRPISWDEINAAWGQCSMLLQCIAKKLNLTFQEFRIVPMGSQSKVIDLANHKEYPLYYSTTGMQLFAASKFDSAMCLFLKCLHQVQQRIEEVTQTRLPYRIRDGGKMQDPRDGRSYSIKWTGNSEENWTKALKMMLLNMKWIIARLTTVERAGSAAPRSAEARVQE